VLLYNRYAAAPGELKNPKDAEQVCLQSPWSEASDPVTIPEDTRFFLASGNARSRDGVKVHLFTWFEGTWVEYRQLLAIGQPIGGEHRVTVTLPDGSKDRPNVGFATGAVVVDIDYDRPLRKQRVKRKDGSFDWDSGTGAAGSTVALVFADADGNLHERLLELDRGGPEYKQMKGIVQKPKVKRRKPPPGGGDRGGGTGAGAGAGGRRGGRGGGAGAGAGGSRGGRGGKGGGRRGGAGPGGGGRGPG
jgi:hypothetical protein